MSYGENPLGDSLPRWSLPQPENIMSPSSHVYVHTGAGRLVPQCQPLSASFFEGQLFIVTLLVRWCNDHTFPSPTTSNDCGVAVKCRGSPPFRFLASGSEISMLGLDSSGMLPGHTPSLTFLVALAMLWHGRITGWVSGGILICRFIFITCVLSEWWAKQLPDLFGVLTSRVKGKSICLGEQLPCHDARMTFRTQLGTWKECRLATEQCQVVSSIKLCQNYHLTLYIFFKGHLSPLNPSIPFLFSFIFSFPFSLFPFSLFPLSLPTLPPLPR